jgi:hypothetical protein
MESLTLQLLIAATFYLRYCLMWTVSLIGSCAVLAVVQVAVGHLWMFVELG